MTDWSSRVIEMRRIEYFLPNPTDWIEISKIISAIDQDRSVKGLSTGDTAVRVRADEDEIVFWWEESRKLNTDK